MLQSIVELPLATLKSLSLQTKNFLSMDHMNQNVFTVFNSVRSFRTKAILYKNHFVQKRPFRSKTWVISYEDLVYNNDCQSIQLVQVKINAAKVLRQVEWQLSDWSPVKQIFFLTNLKQKTLFFSKFSILNSWFTSLMKLRSRLRK